MLKKSLILLLLFIGGVIGAYVYEEIQNKNTLYVIDAEGVLVRYSESERTDIDVIPQAEIDENMISYYNEFVKDKWCFAVFTLGGNWSDTCFDTKKECEEYLATDKNDGMTLNTDKCYKMDLTKAWCIGFIRAGYYRYYFDGSYGEAYEHVCTKNKSLCKELEQYQHPLNKTGCAKGLALTRESLNPYVWKDKEVKELIEKNKTLKPLIFKK